MKKKTDLLKAYSCSQNLLSAKIEKFIKYWDELDAAHKKKYNEYYNWAQRKYIADYKAYSTRSDSVT